MALVDEFSRSIRAELDLVREGRNIDRCARNFEADPTVRLPRVYKDRTASGVLTLEYLDGVKISELEAHGADQATRALIARRGADAMLAQVLVHGFFHADPHPGNVLVMPGGVLAFLDFGCVGRLDLETRDMLARAVMAMRGRDTERLAAYAIALTDPRRNVDRRQLRRDLLELMELYGDVPVGELEMAEVLRDLVATLARHHLRFPPDLLLLVRAIVTVEAVGRHLDPSFRMVEHAAPVAARLWREHDASRALAARARDVVRDSASAARRMPGDVAAVLQKLRDDRLEVQFVHRNLDHFVREMDRSSNRLSMAVVIGSVIVGSSLIIQTGAGATAFGYPVVGLLGFVMAGVLGVGLVFGVLRSGRL
jgi:ubiquinone biosynthesis protein